MAGRVPPAMARVPPAPSETKRKRESHSKHHHHHYNNSSSALADAAAHTNHSNDDDDGDDEREKKRKWTRLLLRELYDLGYSASAATLEREAHVQLRSDAMDQLLLCVEARDWDRALQLVGHPPQSSSTTRTVHMKSQDAAREASLLLLKRKFLDLLVQNQLRSALHTLHREILPAFHLSAADAQALAALLLCRSEDDAEARATIPWRSADVLAHIEQLASPEEIIPRGALGRLIHSSSDDATDSSAGANSAMARLTGSCTAILLEHTSDVLDLAFSPDGALLASSARDGDVIVWNLGLPLSGASSCATTPRPTVRHVLKVGSGANECLAWSPDSRSLVTCGSSSGAIEQWDVSTGTRKHEFQHPAESVAAVQWLPSGQQFVSGSADKSLLLWNVADGSVAYQWGGRRVLDLAVHPDGTRVFVLVSGTEIRTYNVASRADELLLKADALVSCMRLSQSGEHLLVNVIGVEEIVCLEVDTDVIAAKYMGVREQRYVLRPCFSGRDSELAVCGSEDGVVHVWCRETGKRAATLKGHSSAVNSVQCHPLWPSVLASASDDETIRLWTLERQDASRNKRSPK